MSLLLAKHCNVRYISLDKNDIPMALYVKDPEVAAMAEKLASLQKISKTEAIRRALKHEMNRAEKDTFIEWAVEFAKKAKSLGNPANGKPADKAFIDSLYEDSEK